MRTITCSQRKCGRRKKGSAYLVSEPGEDGILPLWTNIDPPVPYNGPMFRGLLQIDLDKLLARNGDYLAGASAERQRHDTIQEPEIQLYGMPLRTRLGIGICLIGGLEAIGDLSFRSVRDLGFSLRSLSRLPLGKAAAEVTISFGHVQESRPDKVLASLWRLWLGCPDKQREDAAPWVRLGMISLGAPEDTLEVCR